MGIANPHFIDKETKAEIKQPVQNHKWGALTCAATLELAHSTAPHMIFRAEQEDMASSRFFSLSDPLCHHIQDKCIDPQLIIKH